MVTTKPKMSASYKAVFALSIIMIFVGMLGGAGSGPGDDVYFELNLPQMHFGNMIRRNS